MLGHDDLLEEGAPLASSWVARAEKIWEKRKKENQPSILKYLNYDQKITNQNPLAKFIVLYNKSGTNISAAYLTADESKRVGQIPIQAFVADHVSYRYYADTEDHALYLVGVLNSTVVNEAIKPYQSQGLKGERDIHRRPFEVCPIPLFNPKNSLHREIAKVAGKAREKVLEWTPKIEGNAAQARSIARKIVKTELSRLDGLVQELLENHKPAAPTASKRARSNLSLFAKPEGD